MNTKKVELLYVWVNEYKKLKQIGFNLSNKYKFHYDPDLKILYRKDNPNYLEDFLPDNISNLTAIIGENGTGKTTFNRFLLENFSEGMGIKKVEAIVIYKMGNSLIVYSNPLIKINSFEPDDYMDTQKLSGLSTGMDFTFIYHTNFFDPTLLDYWDLSRNEVAGMINLSTFYLLFNDTTYLSNEGNPSFVSPKFNDHVKMELQRYVKLITKLKDESLLVKLPQYLIVKTNNDSYNSWKNRLEVNEPKSKRRKIDIDKKDIGYLEKVNNIFESILLTKSIFSEIDLFVLYSFRAAIFNFSLTQVSFFNLPSEEYFNVLIKELRNFQEQLPKKNVEKLINQFYRSFKTYSFLEFSKNLFFNQSRFFSGLFQLAKLSKKNNQKYFNIDLHSLTNRQFKELTEIIEYYYSSYHFVGYNDFILSHDRLVSSNYSSGEYSLLSIFARIYWCFNNSFIKNNIKKNIILILDEAEMTLHPQWQKEFLSILINFVNTIMKEYYVQIIITSHSPFIISDLPSNYINFIEKEHGDSIRIGTLKDNIQTFGQNIHQLFTDSFFMKNGLIGAYASNKISEIIELIMDGSTKAFLDTQEKIRKTIHLIGEPIIKNKLLQLYEDRLRLENIDHEQRISNLENEFKVMKEK